MPHLPSAGEFVLFNRSWYNRAGVEPVMHFCTPVQAEDFLHAVVPFEHVLVQAGILPIKFYLDIGRDEQRRRLKSRARDPLSQWKTSAVDEAALERWDDYTRARDAMLPRTHSRSTAWTAVHADDKKQARLNIIRDLVRRIELPTKGEQLEGPDARVVFCFRPDRLGALARWSVLQARAPDRGAAVCVGVSLRLAARVKVAAAHCSRWTTDNALRAGS